VASQVGLNHFFLATRARLSGRALSFRIGAVPSPQCQAGTYLWGLPPWPPLVELTLIVAIAVAGSAPAVQVTE
jgi:hypothetical protein